MKEPAIPHYFWVMGIVVTCINAAIGWYRSKPYIRQQPDLAPGYRRLLTGVLITGTVPWLVMGAGIIWGGVPGVFGYFQPREGNPFVLAFIGVVIVWWLLGIYWLFFLRGAEFLVRHPGFFRNNPQNPNSIRLTFAIGVAAGIVALVLMFSGFFLPNFPSR